MTTRRPHVLVRLAALLAGLMLFAAACSDDSGSLSDLASEQNDPSEQFDSPVAGNEIQAPDYSGRWTIISFLDDTGSPGSVATDSAWFEIVDGAIRGNLGCNEVGLSFETSGPYAEAGAINRNLRGQSVTIRPGDSTSQGCEEPFEIQESQLLDAFSRAERWAKDDDLFFLLGADFNEVTAQRSS